MLVQKSVNNSGQSSFNTLYVYIYTLALVSSFFVFTQKGVKLRLL